MEEREGEEEEEEEEEQEEEEERQMEEEKVRGEKVGEESDWRKVGKKVRQETRNHARAAEQMRWFACDRFKMG